MLLPAIFSEEDLSFFEESIDSQKEPVKTYKMDLDTGEIYAIFIDGNEAISQHVVKTVKTSRDRYLIYGDEYGSDLEYLIGKSFSDEYLEMEAVRLVNECLADYDRINNIEDVKIQRTEDSLYLEITIETDLSDLITVEVNI